MDELLNDSIRTGKFDACVVLDISSDILNDEFEFEMAMRVLPIKWRNKVMNKKNDSDRKKALCNRLLQLIGCSIVCNIQIRSLEFDIIQNGKPILVNQDINNGIVTFSMTNGQNFVAIYLKRGEPGSDIACDVGIDLASAADLADPINLELYQDIFGTAEYESLQLTTGTELKRLFAYHWSFKESYTKYTGTGISCDLKVIDAGKLEDFNKTKEIDRIVEGNHMTFYSTWLNHTYPEMVTLCQPKTLHNKFPKLYTICLNDILSFIKK